jgi:uncharacterized spore protein YtfJ
MHVDQIMQTAKDAITVRRVFGEPYEHDGLTVIPAAAVTGGLGGGAGRDAKGQDGEGGGALMTGRPVGAYVIKDGVVSWKPAIDPARLLTAACVVTVVYLVSRRPRSRT